MPQIPATRVAEVLGMEHDKCMAWTALSLPSLRFWGVFVARPRTVF